MRRLAFFAIFALFWVTTSPYLDLRNPNVLLATDEGNALQQLCLFGVLAMAVSVLAQHRDVIVTGISPALLCILAWQSLTVVTSQHPDLSIRRFVSSVIVLVIALAWPLVPRDEAQFSRSLTIGLLGVLGLAYFGVVFLPAVSIHNLDEVLELNNAGGWRGHFAHKNIAGAAMVFTIIYSLYIRRREGWVVAGCIAVGALVFLYKSDNKTSIGLIATVFVLSALVRRTRSLGLKAVLVFGPVGTMALLTIGSVIFPPIHDILVAVSSDPTYTARTDVWRFGLDQLAHHPLLGYGYDAFWATSDLVNGGYGIEGWASLAGHAHNGALNIALATGIPGMLLVLYWILWEPLRDYHLAQASGNDPGLGLMYLRVWIFALLYSCLESPFFVSRGPIWFSILGAIFGLRYHAHAALAQGSEAVEPRTWSPAAAVR